MYLNCCEDGLRSGLSVGVAPPVGGGSLVTGLVVVEEVAGWRPLLIRSLTRARPSLIPRMTPIGKRTLASGG